MLLHLLGLVPLDAEAEVQPLPTETAPPVRIVDYLAVLIAGLAAPYILHLEFQLDWWADLPRRIARYGASLVLQYERKVVSVVLLLRPDRVPEAIPKVGRYDVEGTFVEHPFLTARIWEIDPAPLLATKDPRLFPWAVLMKCDDETVRGIGRVLAEVGDEESVARYLTLGSLRYDRRQLEEWSGGRGMTLEEAVIEGSWIFQDRLVKTRADGIRDALKRCLRGKFPGLETLPELDTIKDSAVLESLIDHFVASADRAQMERAILNAARN